MFAMFIAPQSILAVQGNKTEQYNFDKVAPLTERLSHMERFTLPPCVFSTEDEGLVAPIKKKFF